jgi:glutamate-5-semialdehyde dehydrogenase
MNAPGVGVESESATAVSREQALDAEIRAIGRRARAASRALATCPTSIKNAALRAMAQSLRKHEEFIIDANTKDLKAGADAGLSKALLDRLDLGRGRVAAMAASIDDVAKLPDPVGEILGLRTRPNGLRLGRMRAPIGVVGIIYESRPNVTADAGCLCVKSGNAVILRGGSEAFHSNQAIARLMEDAGRDAGLPDHAIQFVPTTDRAAVQILLALDEDIDVIIPRGGRGLVEMIVERSRIPVIRHLDGNCFIFVDASADLEQAVHIILNAKTQRTGVCNALESLLIHQDVAARLVPPLVAALRGKGVEIRADEAFRKAAGSEGRDLRPVSRDDWKTEYLDLILSAGIVGSLDEACEFINTHGSHHTDAILTRDHAAAMRFLSAVDSACVFINASTRFADGGEFGLGCEIGISTNKLHARGPMGLEELTTSKWVAFGEGQVRT